MGCRKLSYYEGGGSEEKSPLKIFRGLEEKNDSSIFCIDYYPFGLSFNSYQRSFSKKNNYLFNQGTGEKTFKTERIVDLDLQVDMTKFRVYDPSVGRWWQVDPKADQAGQEILNPYHYSFNNPIRYNDPFGDCPPNDPNCQARQNIGNLKAAALQKNVSSKLKSATDHAKNTVKIKVGAQAAGSGAKLKLGKAIEVGLEGRVLPADVEMGTNGDVAVSSSELAGKASLKILGVKVVDAEAEIGKSKVEYKDGKLSGETTPSVGSTNVGNEFSVGVTLSQVSAEVSANLDAIGQFLDDSVEAAKQYFKNLIGPIFE